MTNFEKWKQSLKIEDFDREDPIWNIDPNSCSNCPLHGNNCTPERSCHDDIVDWFKKEAQ